MKVKRAPALCLVCFAYPSMAEGGVWGYMQSDVLLTPNYYVQQIWRPRGF